MSASTEGGDEGGSSRSCQDNAGSTAETKVTAADAKAAAVVASSPSRKRPSAAPPSATPSSAVASHSTPKKQRLECDRGPQLLSSPAPQLCTPPRRVDTAASAASLACTTPVTGPLLPADQSVPVTIRPCKLTPKKDVLEEIDEMLADSPPRRGSISRNCPLSEQLRRHVPRQAPTGVSNVHLVSPLRSRLARDSLVARVMGAHGDNGMRSSPATPAVAQSERTSNGAAASAASSSTSAAAAASTTPPARRVKLFGTPPPASLVSDATSTGSGGGGGSGRPFSARIAQQQRALAAGSAATGTATATAAAVASSRATVSSSAAAPSATPPRTSPRLRRSSFKQLF